MNSVRLLIVSASSLLFAGCAAIGNSEFKCSAPTGVHCQSVTATYLNSLSGFSKSTEAEDRAPVSRNGAESDEALAKLPRYGAQTAPILRTALGGKMPLRTDPRLLRLWVKQWEDSDGDYHDQSHIYLPVDAGRWTAPHNRPAAQQSYQGIAAPTNRPAEADPQALAKEKLNPKEIAQSAADFAKNLGRSGEN